MVRLEDMTDELLTTFLEDTLREAQQRPWMKQRVKSFLQERLQILDYRPRAAGLREPVTTTVSAYTAAHPA